MHAEAPVRRQPVICFRSGPRRRAPGPDPLARSLPRAGPPDHRRITRLDLRLGSPRRARRHLRSRLSGSENFDAAINGRPTRCADGLENVRLDPVKVPHWVRGAESLEIVAPGRHPLAMLGLKQHRDAARRHPGRPPLSCAVFRSSMPPATAPGPDRALQRPVHDLRRDRRLSAVTALREPPPRARSPLLVRAVGPPGLRTPHTDRFATRTASRSPAAAVSSEDADRLQRMHNRGTRCACGCGWRPGSFPTPTPST